MRGKVIPYLSITILLGAPGPRSKLRLKKGRDVTRREGSTWECCCSCFHQPVLLLVKPVQTVREIKPGTGRQTSGQRLRPHSRTGRPSAGLLRLADFCFLLLLVWQFFTRHWWDRGQSRQQRRCLLWITGQHRPVSPQRSTLSTHDPPEPRLVSKCFLVHPAWKWRPPPGLLTMAQIIRSRF